MVCIVEAVPTPVTDKITIHRLTETSFKPRHFAIADTGNDVASERAVDAERRASLKIPSPAGEAGGFIRIDPRRTDINEVSGKWTFERAVLETTEIGVVSDLHGSQVAITGKLLIEPATSPAVDTTVHFVLDKDAQGLIMISSLFPEVVSDPMAPCHC